VLLELKETVGAQGSVGAQGDAGAQGNQLVRQGAVGAQGAGGLTTTDATTLNGISAVNLFNNMGQTHGTRTSFDASSPSYNFGFRYVQGTGNGPATGGGGQFYSWYQGLGSEYAATGGGSYGMYIAIPRTATTPYMSVRYNEGNSLGSWIKIAAGFADSAPFDGLTSKASGTGTYTTSGDFRAPIFYDCQRHELLHRRQFNFLSKKFIPWSTRFRSIGI
jgi:hypothetical protein